MRKTISNLTQNLTVTYGLRWDWDGPLYEANGLMTNFYPQDYGYDLATDSFNSVNGTPGIGIVVPAENKTLGTKGVSASTLTGRQWGFAPRIGVAWSPHKNFVVRAGFGMFYDRGEYFTELSASAGLGISGPFSVTTQEPSPFHQCRLWCRFTDLFDRLHEGAQLPFQLAPLEHRCPLRQARLRTSLTSCQTCAALAGCNQRTGSWPAAARAALLQPYFLLAAAPFLFGGYDPANKLPYSENWSLDLQWQPSNDIVVTLGYLGNHGVHQVLPIPFNQPGLATPTNPINNQIYSYGYLAATPTTAGGCDDFNDSSPTCIQLPTEAVQTTVG